MATTVGDISDRLSRVFNLNKAAGWDPVGLQLGDPAAAAARIAVCHEVTPVVADKLVDEGVDFAVTYHPLLFRPTQALIAGSGPAGRAHRLVANGIALFVAHTAFDVLPGGTADSLAKALGISDVTEFGPAWGSDLSKVVTFAPPHAAAAIIDAMAGAGAGVIGRYTHCSYRGDGTGTFFPQDSASPVAGSPGKLNHEAETRVEMLTSRSRLEAVVAALVRAHPYEEPAYDVIETRANAGFIGRRGRLDRRMPVAELAKRVGERLGGVVRFTGDGSVGTVAVIPGSGGSLLDHVDADVVVTGDVSHHQARDALARGLRVVDPGHAATERPGVQSLYAAVAEMVGSTIDLTDIDSDPWKER